MKHYRGNQLVQVVDLYDLLLHGVKSDMRALENGDTVLVPPIGPQVTVEGMVRRPAIYELKDEKNLASVLELAGGLLPTAALRHIEVQRLVAHDKQTMLSLDIPEMAKRAEVTQEAGGFRNSGRRSDSDFPDRAVQPGRGLSRRPRDSSGAVLVSRRYARDGCDRIVQGSAAGAGDQVCGNYSVECAGFSPER